MKKYWLLFESAAGIFYMMIMLIAAMVFSLNGQALAMVMAFFLGVWQYGGGLIWIVGGDKRRKNYFFYTSTYLFLLFTGVYLGLVQRFEIATMVTSLTIPPALAIWYQVITCKHYIELEARDKIVEDDNGASQLL
jgi:hypothetical protein